MGRNREGASWLARMRDTPPPPHTHTPESGPVLFLVVTQENSNSCHVQLQNFIDNSRRSAQDPGSFWHFFRPPNKIYKVADQF